MQVLVIGATGYIGSRAVVRLVAAGHTVRGTARNEAGAAKVRSLGAEVVAGDLENLDALLPHVKQADAVLYAAQLMLQPEHEAVKTMLDALAGTDKTFIFTSGTGVVSQRTDGEWSEDSFAEHDDFVPSRYIGFRRVTELLVQTSVGRGIRAMVVRPPMIWGHGQCGMLRAMAESAAKTGAVCYVGRGLNLYSSVHVDDLAELYHLVIAKGQPGALYHAVSCEVNNRTLAEHLARELGMPARSVTLAEAGELWGKFTALIAMSTCSRTRSPRSRRELGWQPHPDRLDYVEETRHPALLALGTAKA